MNALKLREDLASASSYKQGKAAPASTSELEVFKLSSNENPFPPLPSVQRSIAELAAGINRYPDSSGALLVNRLAERYDVDPANVVLGSGSVEIVSQLIRATSGPGDEVLFAWRSFEAYPMLVRAGGAEPVMVPLTEGLEHDLDAMIEAITDRTRLIMVCNPNNPTGTTVPLADLERFIARVPKHITVVIDEAYQQFNTQTDAPDGVALFKQHTNVAVAHTFSKAYGLAGLRVGYAIVPEQLGSAMRAVALPFGVTALAQHAADLSLNAEDELAERVEGLIAERTRVAEALRSAGVPFPDSEANFLWLPYGEKTEEVAELLEQNGLLVRPFPGEGFRVTIAETAANDRLIAVLSEYAAN